MGSPACVPLFRFGAFFLLENADMATRAERLAELEADLTEVKAALSKARKAVAVNTGNLSINRSYKDLLAEKESLEKRIADLDGTRSRFGQLDMSGGL